ncbi:TetR/AcrR family transcriptional regulator [Maricaulis salignorans]|uniref:TetR/AcrR family transcriptional regulator n=1 Tax=Maricaulis salignorans TaxID=144026 RepID=UPI000B894E7E|nr:TetR/AcrR family transcriptional regulator [Maricaulis salignorans]
MKTSPATRAGTDAPAPKKTRGRPGLTDQDREVALQAARVLLAEQGLNGLQARAIARKAGLSVGSIYKLFGDIDALVRFLNLETHQEFSAHHRAALAAISPDESDVETRLMVLARAYLDFVLANSARWEAVLHGSRRTDTSRPADYVQSEDNLFAIVESVIADVPGFAGPGQRARAARALWASVHGIVSLTLANSRGSDPAAEAMAQIGVILGAVIRDASAAQ